MFAFKKYLPYIRNVHGMALPLSYGDIKVIGMREKNFNGID